MKKNSRQLSSISGSGNKSGRHLIGGGGGGDGSGWIHLL